MVNSQARRLVPSSNLSRLVQALIKVSWTRSSASEALWLSDQAKARSAGIRATTSSRQLELGAIITAPSTQRMETASACPHPHSTHTPARSSGFLLNASDQ